MKEIKHFTRIFTQIFTSSGILLIAFETNICYIHRQFIAPTYYSKSLLFTGVHSLALFLYLKCL